MSIPLEPLQDLEARTRALLQSDAVTPPTRKALLGRLDRRFMTGALLTLPQRRTLRAACLRLIPEPDLVARIDLAAAFESKLAEGSGRGWRYAGSAEDVALHRAGLDSLDAAARVVAGCAFADLEGMAQDRLLGAAGKGTPPTEGAPAHWFEELITALSELFYAHPLVQLSIGYDGMADAHGIQAVGLQAVAAEAERLGR